MNADLDHSGRQTLCPQDGWAQWSTFHSISRVLRRLSRFLPRIRNRMSIVRDWAAASWAQHQGVTGKLVSTKMATRRWRSWVATWYKAVPSSTSVPTALQRLRALSAFYPVPSLPQVVWWRELFAAQRSTRFTERSPSARPKVALPSDVPEAGRQRDDMKASRTRPPTSGVLDGTRRGRRFAMRGMISGRSIWVGCDPVNGEWSRYTSSPYRIPSLTLNGNTI